MPGGPAAEVVVEVEPKPVGGTGRQESVRAEIATALPDVIALRRELHRYPELSYQEQRTSRRIQDELSRLGIAYRAGLAKGTGVVAYIPPTEAGGAALPSVGLRADMDALPIVEATGKSYASQTPGVMHACGHDGHVAILLGAARVLMRLPVRPRGVTLIFQPAEEGGAGGAAMCDDGCLRGQAGGGLGSPVGRIFGLHGWPTLPLGITATRPGPLLAAVDDFEVIIRGTQAHGAYPHQGNDPIVAAAHVVVALQSLVARNVPPLESAVLTVGAIQGGTATNIIPQEVKFIGTVRTLTTDTRTLMEARFKQVVAQTALALGCAAAVDWQPSYPVTHNDATLAEEFLALAARTLGPARVQRVDQPTMGGEDFAYYGQHVPACFFLVGLKPPGTERVPMLHQPDFDFNDDAITTGVELMVAAALAEW